MRKIFIMLTKLQLKSST